MPFDGPLDEAALPSPAASVEDDSPLWLVDVDPDSPHRGERFPVATRWNAVATGYQGANTLAVAPVHGFPLRRGTTYAVIVTTAIATANPGYAAALAAGEHAEVVAAVAAAGLTAADVAIAATFTTDDPLAEMDRIARALPTLPQSPLAQTVEERERTLFFRVFTGAYDGPLFQHGDRPYATEGGGFKFAEDGSPIVAAWEPIRIGIVAPPDLSTAPAAGFPVVVYAHGTGGDYLSLADDGERISAGAQIAQAGMVGIGFDQPLHGTRATPDTIPSTHTFNYVNPEAALGNFRQGAIDGLYLAHLIRTQQVVFTTPTGEVIPLDPDKILFLGHSQGGLTGALALPWMGATTRAAMLSAAGGLLSITVVDRKDPIDIAAVFAELLRFGPTEAVSEDHPVVGLLQLLVEPTDPINYAPCWYEEDCGLFEASPTSVLLTNGTADVMTPYRSAEALAAAGHMPILAPNATWPEAWDLRGLPLDGGPLAGDAPAWDGGAVTSAFSQWEGGSHFVVFEDADASNMVAHFLESAAAGEPEVAR